MNPALLHSSNAQQSPPSFGSASSAPRAGSSLQQNSNLQPSPPSVRSTPPAPQASASGTGNPATGVSADDVKPPFPGSGMAHRDSNSGNISDASSPSDGDDDDRGVDDAKRPRLRLAHACDRCRKRKIRCDTQAPCGPCQATKNECTFNTPSRRIAKPKGSENRSSSTSGVKRPHSPPGSARIAALGSEGQANLEARLAALEAMLGDVPPKVHNAFLSSLDARLGSGGGVGISGGSGEGVGVALEALAGGNLSNLSTMLSGIGGDGSWNGNGLGANSTLTPGWGVAGPSRAFAGGRGVRGDVNDLTRKMEGMSFFYEDEIGQAKWQGATSGFPLLDLLTANNAPPETEEPSSSSFTDTFAPSPDNPMPPPPNVRRQSSSMSKGRSSSSFSKNPPSPTARKSRFFPDRTPRPHQTLNPEASWKVITGVIPPDLMDTLVRCYLSTSHLLWPFLHVPSFLQDYANPQQWGEPGFACFIVSVCTLSSRHVDDPRVRANPQDPSTAGKRYFELFKRLRDLPSADRPTLYSIQAAFLAAVYAFGLGNLSKAFALLAESITLCLDGGLHRSVDGYDHFNMVEKETRKRTFWSIYSWDKQSAALFGRPPIIHLRDCDVTEPIIVDDEDLSPDGIKERGKENNSRMCAFVATIRLHVILEGVIDAATSPSTFPTSPFLAQASATIARRAVQSDSLKEEEALVEEWKRILPKYWQYDDDTTNSMDPIRITQAERLHCLEHLVKMLIYRHRFSGFVNHRASTSEEKNNLLDICRKAMQCALTIIADHVHISQRGMMTYYGVHVIHQLAQAGRTLVAVILNCRNGDFRPMIAPCIEGLRSCVGLLRRFSGRYLCGLRSADIIDEFCRICNIPVDSPRVPDGTGRPSPAWLRPVRKRASASPAPDRPSPSNIIDFTGGSGDIMSNPAAISQVGQNLNTAPPATDLEALFNTSDYFDLSAMSPGPSSGNEGALAQFVGLGEGVDTLENFTAMAMGQGVGGGIGGTGNSSNANGNGFAPGSSEQESVFEMMGFTNPAGGRQEGGSGQLSARGNAGGMSTLMSAAAPGGSGPGQGGYGTGQNQGQGSSQGMAQAQGQGQEIKFDFGFNGAGFGGEQLAGEGMDSVSDGLKGKDAGQGLSAATILSLLEEGSFDYGSVFTDQAPLPMDFESGV